MGDPPWGTWNGWLTTVRFDCGSMPGRVRRACGRPWRRRTSRPASLEADAPAAGASQTRNRVLTGVADTMFAEGLCLPSGTAMTDDDVDRVLRRAEERSSDAMSGFYRRRGKRLLDVAVRVRALLAHCSGAGRRRARWCAEDGPPVLFRQQRPGLGGRPFELLKFRTMRTRSTRTVVRCPMPIASRRSVAAAVRRASTSCRSCGTCSGDMSLVGPRPLLMEYLPRYTPEQARRHEVRPGITGWAQVNGRNALSWDEKFALDVWYVDHVSLAPGPADPVADGGCSAWQRRDPAEGHATMPSSWARPSRYSHDRRTRLQRPSTTTAPAPMVAPAPDRDTPGSTVALGEEGGVIGQR